MMTDIALNWTVGHTGQPEIQPDRWVAAPVPGAANLDWAVAENWPDWRHGTNYQLFHWTEDRFWIYRAEIPAVDLRPDQRLWLVSQGVDYHCDILVNGHLRYSHEGMFSPLNWT
jgi:beta-mannosidase